MVHSSKTCSILVFLFPLLIVFNNCSEENYSLTYSGKKLIYPNSKTIQIEEITDNSKFIFLSEPSIKKLGRITFTSDSNLIIQDIERSSLFLYSEEGNFISKLDRKGRGPDEYLNIDDFIISKKTVTILDGRSQILKSYSLPDFEYINSRQLPFSAKKFSKASFGYTFYKGGMANNKADKDFFYDIINTDNNLNIISKYKPFKIPKGVVNFNLFYSNILNSRNQEVYFKPFPKDTLFIIDSTSALRAIISFDFKQNSVESDKSNFKSAPKYINYLFNSRNNHSFVTKAIPTNEYIYYQYLNENKLFTGRLDLSNDSLKTFDTIIADYKKTKLPVYLVNYSNNQLIFKIDKINDKYLKQVKEFTTDTNPKVLEKLDSLKSGHINPIIVTGNSK